MNMIQNAKDQVLDLTVSAYQKAAAEGLLPQDAAVTPSVEIPKDTANGDYTTTFCLAAAKAMKMNPRQVAQTLIDNMTLEDIAVNLEHWYNIRIRIDDGVDASTRISFTLRPETLDETLRIIENLTHFACERTDRQHITIRKR